MPKGQLTGLILLGLLLVIVGAMGWFIFSSSGEEETTRAVGVQQQAEAVIRQGLDYVTQCLTLAGQGSLEVAGKQGGYIYEVQGSFAEQGLRRKNHLQDATRKLPLPEPIPLVHYLQTRPVRVTNTTIQDVVLKLLPEPDEYPFGFFPQVRQEDVYLFEPYDACNCHKPAIPPLRRADGDSSIQEMVEAFVDSHFLDCLHNGELPPGLKLSIHGSPSANVLFAEGYTVFNLNATIDLTVEKVNYTKRVNEFITTVPVRFKKIYDFLTNVTYADSTNITHNISTDAYDSMSVSVQQDMDSSPDDILTITDQKSKILDLPFEFSWVRDNRPPGLFYINQSYIYSFIYCNGTTLSIENNTLYISNGCNMFEHHMVLDPLPIPLNATDPDEDIANFTLFVNGRTTNNYTITREDVIKANRANETFKVDVRAFDNELFDWQTLNLSVAFPITTSYFTGGKSSSSYPLEIPGLVIKGRLAEVYADDGNTISVNGNVSFNNAPCGLLGNGDWPMPCSRMCDRFEPDSQPLGGSNPFFFSNITYLLQEGNNLITVQVTKCPKTKNADGWFKLNYTYLSPYPTTPVLIGPDVTGVFEAVGSCRQFVEEGIYTLDSDIAAAGPVCFSVEQEGVAIDCNNHVIRGSGGIGIFINSNFSGLKIANCNFVGFDIGLQGDDLESLVVVNSRFADNKIGIFLNATQSQLIDVLSCGNTEQDIELTPETMLTSTFSNIRCTSCDSRIRTATC